MQGLHQGNWRLWLATVATAAAYSAAHPPWSVWPLALVAVAPVSAVLLDASRPVPALRAAAAGLVFGALATWLTVGHWSFLAARDFFEGREGTALAFTLALPLVASAVAVPYAVAFALVARLAGLGATAGIVGSAALWSAAELTRSTLGYGNPWASFAAALHAADTTLSSAAHAETPVGALLAIGGPAAVALVAAASGSALGTAWALRHDRPACGRALAAATAAVGVALAASALLPSLLPRRAADAVPERPLRVALVQSGIGGRNLWQGRGAADSLARHIELTRSADTAGADLVVWPENALAFLLDANPDHRQALRALARERGSALLVGGSHAAAGAGRTTIHNSAFLFPADGSEPVAYDKRVLLPFVEKVPAWAAWLLASPWQGAFASGSGEVVFRVAGWKIAPLLCLEAIYDSEAASRAARGADLLVNLSNDSWFDAGAGPEQHFALAALAAAETQRPLVRVSTTGITALVTDEGLLAWTMPRRTAGVALLDVPPPLRDSLFTRGGRSGFVMLVCIVALAAALLPRLARRG